MTGTLSTEVIIFAIHSAIKLGSSFEKAYAISLRSKSIVLPLPSVKPGVEFIIIKDFFDSNGKEYVDEITKLKDLHDIAAGGEPGMSDNQKKQYEAYYRRFAGIVNRSRKDSSDKPYISGKGLVCLLKIRQWQKDDPQKVKPLQLIAGSLVEIGIDYFNQVPGAIRSDSAYANVLRSFLQGVDKVKFSEDGSFKDKIIKEVVPELFVSVAENIDTLSGEFINDKKLQEFIQATSTGLTTDLYKRIEDLGDAASREDKKEVINWGKLVFTSLIKNSGEYVFNSPDKVFGTDEAQSALIQGVGKSLMSAILEKPLNEDLQNGGTAAAPSGLDLKNLFTIDTLDKVVQSSLTVVAQYPSLISDKQGVKEIIVQVAETVAKSGIKQPGLVPELVRMVLASTAGHLEQLWDVNDNSAKHLLITTVQQLLTALSTPTDGSWRPKLTNQQILAIAESSFSEVIKNQAWIKVKAENSKTPLLAEVISTTFAALGAIPEGQRLSFDTMEKLIKINLRAVATSQLVLNKITFGSQVQNKSILNTALDLVLNRVFKDDNQKTGDPVLFLFDLLEYVMDTVVSKHPDKKGLVLTQLLLNANSGVFLNNGLNKDLANQLVEASLSVLSANPDLLVKEGPLQNIIAGVAGTFQSTGIDQPGLLGEFIRVALLQASGNLDLLIPDADGKPKQLIVLATKVILEGLTTKSGSGVWKPKFSGVQILSLSEILLNEVVLNPNWISDKVNTSPLLGEVLDTTFKSLGAIPEGQRLNFQTLEKVIKINLRTVAASQMILNEIPWGTSQEKKSILNNALDLVFDFTLNNKTQSPGDPILFLFDTLEFIMDGVVAKHPDKKGLILTQMLLNENSGVFLNNGLNKDLANQLVEASLGVLSTNPDLLVKEGPLQNIIAGVAGTFQSTGIDQPGLLGEFIRVALLQASGNLDLLIPDAEGKPKQLIVLATNYILEGLTAKPNSGKWRPKLTGSQILNLSEVLLGEVVRNPNWVSDKVNKDVLLQEVLGITFSIFNKYPEGQRVNFETLKEIIEQALKAVALNKLILHAEPQKEAILSQAMDLVFGFVYNEPTTVDKSELLVDVMDYAFGVVIADHPNDEGIVIIMSLLKKELGIVSSTGINEDLANRLVVSTLNALAEHPELVTDKSGIQNIIVGVSSALVDFKTKNPTINITEPVILSEFVRLILENTAGNLNLIIDTSQQNQKNILVLALQQVLEAISKKPSSGKWKPKLTPVQILQITEMILDRILENPQWVKNDWIKLLIELVYQSVEQVPTDKPLNYSTLEILIEEAIKAANTRVNLIVKKITDDQGNEKLALSYALDGFFAALFDESKGTIGTWTLTQSETLNTIITYYLSFLTGQTIDKAGMDKAIEKVENAIKDLNEELLFDIESFLNSLNAKIQSIDIT